jgi:NADH-ubiquinone oxidoreductase chain 6
MNIHFISTENFGFFSVFLNLIMFLCIFFGIFIIISKNPVVSVLHLIALFSCISFYLLFLGLNFIGLSYLLVYVGAVSILFLFILMLINIRISELISNTYNNIPLSLLVILALFIPYNNISSYDSPNLSFFNKLIFFVSSKN